jgi:nitric oxide reductase large subunit
MEKRRADKARDKKNKGWKLKAGLTVLLSLCLMCAGLYFVTLQIEKTLWYPRTGFFSLKPSGTGWDLRILGMDFYIVFHGRG